MALHIIIDGYNLIRQSSWFGPMDQQDIQLGREALIDSMAAYKRIKGHRVTIVFDGVGAPSFSQNKDRVKGIDIRYSWTGELADSVIKRMTARLREKALVVSSDREVADYAVSKGAVAVSSPEFEDKIRMAAYMEVKGVDETSESSQWVPTTKKKGPRKRLSKKTRKKKNKLKKL